MIEFNIQKFASLLRKAPGGSAIPEAAAHSEYLQTHVFDVLMQGRDVDLKTLDFNAFTLQDLTSDSYRTSVAENADGWAKSFNRFVKDTPAATLNSRMFF